MPSANCIYVESRIVRDTQLRDFIFPRDSNTTCYGDNVERRGPGINIYDTMFVFVIAFFLNTISDFQMFKILGEQ